MVRPREHRTKVRVLKPDRTNMSLMGKLLIVVTIGLSFVPNLLAAKNDSVTAETAKLLPEQIGNFKAIGAAAPLMPDQAPRLFGEGTFVRTYEADGGGRYVAQLQTTANDAESFALLTGARSQFKSLGRDGSLSFDEIGTASCTTPAGVFFYKGNV